MPADADVDDNMNCMEVWGGNAARDTYLRRPGLDIWIWSQPRNRAEAGGGDLHLISSCASGRITRMLLADVCGFGTLFAEIADELRKLLKRNVNTIWQARAVREMGLRLEHASHQGGFASTLISTYFAPTRSYTLCNAGHPPPLLYRAADATWKPIKAKPMGESGEAVPVGVIDPQEYQEFTTTLSTGDLILSYSNALTECRASDGSTIGVSGIQDRLGRLDSTKPEQFAAALASRICEEHDQNLASEDATIVLCRVSDTRVGLRNNLLAPFRLLRGTTDRTEIG